MSRHILPPIIGGEDAQSEPIPCPSESSREAAFWGVQATAVAQNSGRKSPVFKRICDFHKSAFLFIYFLEFVPTTSEDLRTSAGA